MGTVRVFVELFVSSLTDLTGALASDGVVEGAVDDAGVRIVLLGATPCLAHRILCLCPESQKMRKILS